MHTKIHAHTYIYMYVSMYVCMYIYICISLETHTQSLWVLLYSLENARNPV